MMTPRVLDSARSLLDKRAFGLFALHAFMLVLSGCRPPGDETRGPLPADTETTGEAHQAAGACTSTLTIQRGLGAGVVSDAHIRSGAPDKWYGASGSLTAGTVTAGGVDDHRQALVHFDLASLPAGAVIESATASLVVILYGGAPVRAHAAKAPWSEGSVTWNGLSGAFSTIVEATFPAGSPTSADITPLVQAWWSGAAPNHGLVLERDPTGLTVFGSSEGKPAARPSLTICYTTCASQPDGTPCGGGDVCVGGVCGGVDLCAGVVCTPQDSCHGSGDCDPSTGLCSNPPLPDGTPCDDGNPSTVNDACFGGLCAGIDNCFGVVCAPVDSCHDAGACDPMTGLCSGSALPDGTLCDDGDLCTEFDTCQSGTCSGKLVQCTAIDACHVAGTCDPSTGVCSNPPSGDPACSGALAIWEIAPPDVSVARAQALAAAFGMPSNAPVEDVPEAIRIVATMVADPGPLSAAPSNMQLSIGSFSSHAESSPPPSALGSVGPDGAYSMAANSTFFGHLSGFVFQGGSGKSVTGTVVSPAAPISGTFDLVRNQVTFTAPLVIRWTCSGTGCFTGSCDVPVTLSTPAAGSSYDPRTGAARVSMTGQVSAVSTCGAGSASSALVNALLGLPASLSFQTDLAFSPAPTSRLETLTLMRASGTISYTNPHALMNQPAAPSLPDDGTAESIATAFLAAHGLMPPNAEAEVMTKDGEDVHGNPIDVAKCVTFEPHLQVGLDANASPILVPVHHAEVDVWIGAGGEIVSFESMWRPVAGKYMDLPSRSESAVRADFAAGLIDLPEAEAVLAYDTADSHVPQRYFDPIYLEVGTDGSGAEYEITGTTATDFAPRLTNLSPLTDVVDGSLPVPLHVSATWGAPPYSFSWSSNRDGVLGTGSDISVPLSNGQHVITLDLTDARGYAEPVKFMLNVQGSSAEPLYGDPETDGPGPQDPQGPSGPAPSPPEDELTSPRWLKGLSDAHVDTAFRAARRDMPGQEGIPEDQRNTRAGPLISNGTITKKGKVVFEEVYLEQFRYEVEIMQDGVKRRMRSDKCYDGNMAGGTGAGACVRPTGFSYSGPWAHGTDNRPPIKISSGSDSHYLGSKFEIEGIPGTLTLLFAYSPFMAPRPAGPGVLDWLALRAGAMQLTFYRPLGGDSPGYRPKVVWYYKPPEGGVSACDVMTFCQQTSPNTNVDLGTGATIPVCDDGMLDSATTSCTDDYANATETKYQVTDFEAHLFTAIRPHSQGRHHYLAIVQDETPANRGNLKASDGGLWRLFQPEPLRLAGKDLFTEIVPMANERTVRVATRGWFPGEFDNVHSKAKRQDGRWPIPWWVFFIGGNSPLHERDDVPVFHMHESWEQGKPASFMQDVYYTFLLDTPANREPMEPPHAKVSNATLHTVIAYPHIPIEPGPDGTTIVLPPTEPVETTTDSMIWHHGKASSKDCRGPNVDNSGRNRKCPYFEGGFFFTH